MAIRCKRYGFIWAVVTELKDVVLHDDWAVGRSGFIEREVKFRELASLGGLKSDATTAQIRFILGGVIDEDVAGHDEIDGLINPSASSAITEGVASHGDVRAALLDADDAAAVGAIDEVAGDAGILTELSQKERAHATAENVIIREDDVLAALNVHGISDGTELATGDAQVASTGDVEGAFAWSAAGRGIRGEVVGLNVKGQCAASIVLEVNWSAAKLFSDFDVGGRGFDDEVLQATHKVLGQVITHEG